ncbi:MAG: hypothetical protein LBN39_01655, partial [Planctomycetaceae bacterium]|nr:hypothetical protein [Planctomycetaceae bacterium]
MRSFTFVFILFAAGTCSALLADSIIFDFESGTLDGWQIIEGQNTKPVGSWDKEQNHPQNAYDKHGKYYLTTLETAAHNKSTDDTICVIESPVFVLTGNETKIFVGGGKRPDTYAGLFPLLENGDIGKVIYEARGEASEKLIEYTWDVSQYKGKPLVLRVVDRETGGWAHIRMDYFRAEGTIDSGLTAKRQQFLTAFLEKRAEEEKAKSTKAREILGETPILYVFREQYRPDHHNTATMFQTGEINTGSFRGGSSLRVWNPKDNSTKVLLDVPEGVVRDPCVSFDGKKILVSMRKNIQDDYHIYELVLNNSDEAAAKQLTFLKGVSDIDPLYLPSGEIVFSSTREPKYCMCNRHIMCNLYKMNGDGSNIQQIGKSTLFEGHSSLMPDGRIIYDRWEYVDRNFGDAQGVWITTTEGFNHAVFWGNNTASPGGVIDARILPGSDSVFIATLGSCHDRPWGAIGIIDRRKGLDGKQAVLQTFPPEAINFVSEEQGQKSFDEVRKYDTFVPLKQKFEDPFPLSDEWFLASGMTGDGEQMGIWLLGRDGTMQLVFKTPDSKNNLQGCFDPMPLAPSSKPPVNTQKADLSKDTGTFYVSNVYEGLGMSAVKKGGVKFLRVIESPEKRTWSAKGWGNGHGEQAPGMNWYEFINKRILGTVPIEDDGSVNFTVPADKFIYFQLLDEQGRMIQTMRSGVIIRPGETNGCVGCHEDRLAVVPPTPNTPKALTKPPVQLKTWYGEPREFSYVKEVQEPVFDKYCVQCHDYGKVEKNPKKPNLAGDLHTIFNESYVTLYKDNLIKPVGAGPHNVLKPYTWGSTQSKLAEVMLNGHRDEKIDAKCRELGIYIDRKTNPEAVDRVLTWIDLNAPYYATYHTSFGNNRFGRSPLTDEQMNRLATLCGH